MKLLFRKIESLYSKIMVLADVLLVLFPSRLRIFLQWLKVFLVGHFTAVIDPETKIDIVATQIPGVLNQPQNHIGSQAAATVKICVEKTVNS